MSMATKLARVGIYNEEFPSIKLSDYLITWSCRVVKYRSCYITTTTRHMSTKFC